MLKGAPTPGPPAGQFVLHAKALPGNPYDGHTLGSVIDATEKLTGCAIERAGYRGHDAANPRCVFISGQKRGVFGACTCRMVGEIVSHHFR